MRPFAPSLRLGLIGGNITATRSPALHMVCGLATGYNVTYDLVIPAERGCDFETAFETCRKAGFTGVNVTYPFKELSVQLAQPASAVVAAMGAANTVKFTPEGPRAHNTDFSGFKAGYRAVLPDLAPGRVLMIGAGGVGRAIAFALADLGAQEITLCDTDPSKAEALAEAVHAHSGLRISVAGAAPRRDLHGFDGVVNCTPLGMVGREGSPLPEDVAGQVGWAFDAVYTPAHTIFRGQMTRLGARFLSGYELYFHQGIDAFEIFSGEAVRDQDWVRATLAHRAGEE
ncbi:ThiF family adenylyltransferase [Paracoccus sp. (in: a-proteobacteria)]|uniref:shikimate dehydrogenase family protein n=1 Tax=Paracoccus sp. TaxID=267 RepID=UPI0032207555